MEKRRLGKTNLEVTAISFGALPMQRCTLEEAGEVLNTALNLGINFIDTARAYTDSEEKIGKGISKRRKDFYLASKSLNRTKEGIIKDIEISLGNMQTDFIDLYQLHNVKLEKDFVAVMSEGGALEGLEMAKAQGKIGSIGITGHNIPLLIKAVQTGKFDTVQVPYNIVEQDAAKELFPLARSLDMGIIIMKPLGGGQIDKADLSLRFILAQKDVVLIPGMDTTTQVQENSRAANPYIPLDAKELAELEAEANIVGKSFCRRCAYCLPCAVGIDIPQVFIFKIQYERYGLKAAIPNRYTNLAVKPSACIDCGLCEKRCPYDIPIRARLKEMCVHMKDFGGK